MQSHYRYITKPFPDLLNGSSINIFTDYLRPFTSLGFFASLNEPSERLLFLWSSHSYISFLIPSEAVYKRETNKDKTREFRISGSLLTSGASK